MAHTSAQPSRPAVMRRFSAHSRFEKENRRLTAHISSAHSRIAKEAHI